jgi:hypothetical protein
MAPPDLLAGDSLVKYFPNPAMPCSIPFAQLLPDAHGMGEEASISVIDGKDITKS